MADYTNPTYLLNRANIHGSVRKMGLYLDTHDWPGLEAEVFAPSVHVDYTALFPGNPYDLPGSEQFGAWKRQTAHLTSSQHLITSVLIDLPRPAPDVHEPTTAKVKANFMVTLVCREARGDPVLRDGCRHVLRMAKVGETGNPWRIFGLAVEMEWVTGSWAIMGSLGGL